jgi:hypothetical protein
VVRFVSTSTFNQAVDFPSLCEGADVGVQLLAVHAFKERHHFGRVVLLEAHSIKFIELNKNIRHGLRYTDGVWITHPRRTNHTDCRPPEVGLKRNGDARDATGFIHTDHQAIG